MSLHFDSFELDYLQPLSFHSSAAAVHSSGDDEEAGAVAVVTASAARHSANACYAAGLVDDDAMLDSSSPFLYTRDLSGLVSPSPAPSSTSCGSSGDSLYDSDELSSLPSAAPCSHRHQRRHRHHRDDAHIHEHGDAYEAVPPGSSQLLHSGQPFDDESDLPLRLSLDEPTASLLTDKHSSDCQLLDSHTYPHTQQFRYEGASDGFEQSDEYQQADMELDVELAMEDSECDEEETATPALAAVPPAEIIQATVADPSFVPNPAFALLTAGHNAAAATAGANLLTPDTLLGPATEQLVPTSSSLPSTVTACPASTAAPTVDGAAAVAVKPKRKYTRRAKPAQLTDAALSAQSGTTAFDCDLQHNSDTPDETSRERMKTASNSVGAALSVPLRSSSPFAIGAEAAAAVAPDVGTSSPQGSALPRRCRSASSDDVDDDASIVSTHSQNSTRSAPLASHTATRNRDSGSTSGPSSNELVVSVASPSASPSSSPASSPRSVVSSTATASPGGTITTATTATAVVRPSMSFSLASLPTLPPPGKPGRKRKNAVPPATSAAATATTDSADGCGRAEHSDGSSDGVAADGSTLNVEGKRMVRLQRNRASAQLSRERKKRYMGELEQRMKQLMDVNHELEAQLSSLAVENAELKKRLGDDTAITPAVAVKKRAKLSRSDSKRAAAGATMVTGSGRTALLMFGIFISFALFYNLVGIEFHSDSDRQLLVASVNSRSSSSSPTYTPPFAGRLLQSLRDSNSLLSGDVALKREPLAIEPPRTLSHQQQQSLALVPVDSSADNRALVVKDEHNEAESTAERSEQHKLYEPFAPYRTHNLTDELPASSAAGGDGRARYVLCADATAIQPLIVDAGGSVGAKRRGVASLSGGADLLHNASRTAKRLRRSLGLPAPVSPTAVAFAGDPDTAASEPSKLALSKDDQLLLWLPSAQLQLPLAAQSPNSSDPAAAAEESPAQQAATADMADMVQVRCQVQALSYVSRA